LKKSIRIVSGGGGRVVHFSKRQVTRQRRSEYLRVGLQHEERHADSYEAAGQRPLQESRAVAVEHANEGGGATVGKDRQKAGGDTQEINPADAFACRSAEAGESVLYRRGA